MQCIPIEDRPFIDLEGPIPRTCCFCKRRDLFIHGQDNDLYAAMLKLGGKVDAQLLGCIIEDLADGIHYAYLFCANPKAG